MLHPGCTRKIRPLMVSNPSRTKLGDRIVRTEEQSAGCRRENQAHTPTPSPQKSDEQGHGRQKRPGSQGKGRRGWLPGRALTVPIAPTHQPGQTEPIRRGCPRNGRSSAHDEGLLPVPCPLPYPAFHEERYSSIRPGIHVRRDGHPDSSIRASTSFDESANHAGACRRSDHQRGKGTRYNISGVSSEGWSDKAAVRVAQSRLCGERDHGNIGEGDARANVDQRRHEEILKNRACT